MSSSLQTSRRSCRPVGVRRSVRQRRDDHKEAAEVRGLTRGRGRAAEEGEGERGSAGSRHRAGETAEERGGRRPGRVVPGGRYARLRRPAAGLVQRGEDPHERGEGAQGGEREPQAAAGSPQGAAWLGRVTILLLLNWVFCHETVR